jgi:flagellin
MVINHNINAMTAHRSMGLNTINAGKSMEKLSSGMRINKAGDDAAGLAISEKMRSQVRGLNQASRNIQDGISMVQTAEGGLNEIHSILQRGRELSVQASNATTNVEDRTSIQAEIDQLTEEVDRIANGTEFNQINLLNKKDVGSNATLTNIIKGLKSGWLQESVDLVQTHYGLSSSNRNLNVVVSSGTPGGTLASVNSGWSIAGATATLTSLTLNIEEVDFDPSTGADGENFMTGSGSGMYNDRIIAHEMVHAVMADTMGDAFYDLPEWFKEGAAEFIHGADERLKNDVVASGGIVNLANRAADLITGVLSWGATPPADMSKNYSAGYFALKFMDLALVGGKTMADLMNDIKNGMGIDGGIANNTTYMSAAAFAGGLQASAIGYYGMLDIQAIGVAENDTGSIGGSDHGGVALDAHDVVSTGVLDDTPTNFSVIFPTVNAPEAVLEIQIGANYGQNMKVALTDVSSSELGIDTTDVINNSTNAISKFDYAIKTVSSNRAILGAIQNRLEHALKVSEQSSENLQASESRIRDVDMAKEMMSFSKDNILGQGAQAMLAQANQQPQGVLQLLRN